MSGDDENAERVPAVSATGLSKHYRLGELHSLRRTMGRLARRKNTDAGSRLEALADVDFTVWRGEAMGLVGRTGSGKSTLLQLLAGTTLPSCGVLPARG